MDDDDIPLSQSILSGKPTRRTPRRTLFEAKQKTTVREERAKIIADFDEEDNELVILSGSEDDAPFTQLPATPPKR